MRQQMLIVINGGKIYLQVNLKQGIDSELNQKNRDTCTACAGTMILEFAALSRLTGDPVFEVGEAHSKREFFLVWSYS